MKRPARHFDRGFRSALRSSLPAVVLLAACSGGLNPSNPGTAGTGGAGTAGIGGTGSATAGIGGTTGIGGTGGATAGIGGTGGATAGIGGTGGGRGMDTGGTGGSGGSVPLPACPANAPTFGICIGNDAEGSAPASLDTHTSGAATIEAVGSAVAPVSCRYGRAIGKWGPSDWWFQARSADNRLWTIGVQGLAGSTPLVSTGDVVTLDVDWKGSCIGPANCFSDGRLQLSDATGTPLLWAGRRSILRAFPNDQTWISFAAGDYVCGTGGTFCDMRQSNVVATVNGSSTTLPPFGAASVGGYFVGVTYFPAGLCGDSAPPFDAAAAKVSP